MKNRKEEYKTISQDTKRLLSLEECIEVDFKRDIKSLEREDLIAFANSENGGTILIGIDEEKLPNGRQGSVIRGCEVGDKPKRQILDKAEACYPAVEVQISIENSKFKPFYRIDIPSGPDKPYSTSSGKYIIRIDGRNRPLRSSDLLRIFIEGEGHKFIEQFKSATNQLEVDLAKILLEAKDMKFSLDSMTVDIEEHLSNLSSLAGDADCNSEEASSNTSQLLGDYERLSEEVEWLKVRLDEGFEGLFIFLSELMSADKDKLAKAQIKVDIYRMSPVIFLRGGNSDDATVLYLKSKPQYNEYKSYIKMCFEDKLSR